MKCWHCGAQFEPKNPHKMTNADDWWAYACPDCGTYQGFNEASLEMDRRPLRFKESEYTLNMLRQLINEACMNDWRNERDAWGKEGMRAEHVRLRHKLRVQSRAAAGPQTAHNEAPTNAR